MAVQLRPGRRRYDRRLTAARRPPRRRTVEDTDDRHASALELFFDLVFVVAVAEVGETLSHDTSAIGYLHFGVLFIPVWWAWVGYTFYLDRFDTDDIVLRVTLLAAMLAVTWLAVEIPHAFADPTGAANFAAAYACVRLLLVALYVRADHHDPRARPLTRRYIAGFATGATVWLASVSVGEPARFVLWGLAIAIELTPPLLSSGAFRRVPFHVSHIPERFAAFTTIALGETVMLVATGMASDHLPTGAAVTAAFGFIAAACIWWLYFDFFDASPVGARVLAPQAYAYGHLVVFTGITAAGVGTLHAIRAGSGTLAAGGRWALCGGAAAYLLAIALIHVVSAQRWRETPIWSRLGTTALLAALAAAGASIPADALTIAVAASLIGAILTHGAFDNVRRNE
jgi:low temperature requirement protein LtrA